MSVNTYLPTRPKVVAREGEHQTCFSPFGHAKPFASSHAAAVMALAKCSGSFLLNLRGKVKIATPYWHEFKHDLEHNK